MLGPMPITPDEAVKVAKEHGLTLADARALGAMSDDVDHAGRLAAHFQPDKDADETAEAKAIAARVESGGF
jgi:hypothetical protein